MILRPLTKQESFVRAIPNNSRSDDIEPLIHTLDGSMDDNIKAFKEKKTLYIILQAEIDNSRPSAVTERNFSSKPELITDIENELNNFISNNHLEIKGELTQKRNSSICESLKSLRDRKLRESLESPRFGHDSRHSSVTKKNSMMLPRDYNDELDIAYTTANIRKLFDKRNRYFSFNQSSNNSLSSSEN